MNYENEVSEFVVAGSLGYAVKPNGSWRAVSAEMELEEDETFYKSIPEWAIQMEEDRIERARLVTIENAWRDKEINVIANQLMAIEEAESALEEGLDPPDDLMSGTRSQWLSYRTKVRAWKEGNVDFPDANKRPVRPT